MTKRHPDHDGTTESLHGQRSGHDPLQAAAGQSDVFNRSWLKNGESMTLIQRVGYTIFSLFFFGAGLYLCGPTMIELRDGDPGSLFFAVLFGLASLFFLLFGILGLRNVLRFRR
jgi:hypothetical protein